MKERMENFRKKESFKGQIQRKIKLIRGLDEWPGGLLPFKMGLDEWPGGLLPFKKGYMILSNFDNKIP